MKKRGVLIVVIILLLLPVLIIAQENETDEEDKVYTDYSQQIQKAYSCLLDKVGNRNSCENLNAEEQAFSLLSLSYDDNMQRDCKDALIANSNNEVCWPSGNCNLKDTALSVLALDYVREDVSQPANWLISKNKTPTDLIWYLQIDTNEMSSCKITYGSSEYTVNIGDNKKLDRNAGSCLTRDRDNYWLRISPSCYERKFTISCDKEFITNLLYKKETSRTIYVSSKTSSAPADGETEESVKVKCFAQGGKCDYEGSLWATLALSRLGKDVSSYIPYLAASSVDNERYFPEAFLYLLTVEDVYFSNIISLQTPGNYWNVDNSPYNKFYDTSLAILSLFSSSPEELEQAKTYLFSVQGSDGCWQGIRDTAFILFAGWPRAPASLPSDIDYCTDYGHYCISRVECVSAGGDILDNFYCPNSLSSVCCSSPAIQKTCLEKGGEICGGDESCSGSFVTSLDSSDRRCCIGTCKEVQINECDQAGYECKSSCSDDEETKPYSCPNTLGGICCGEKSGGSSWWIWLLVILIILVILAIIFRNKLKIMWFKFRNKGKPGKSRKPGLGKPGFRKPGFPSRGIPPNRRPMMPPPNTKKPEELDETLKRLKEIGD